jgi:hypothetical protein
LFEHYNPDGHFIVQLSILNLILWVWLFVGSTVHNKNCSNILYLFMCIHIAIQIPLIYYGTKIPKSL